MIKYFTNRELSKKLNINLARWKRWSREFLPPDPLGGMQSGYARQYSPDDAFCVYLGGHLVSDLKFTIPQTKQILFDLNQWLKDKGFSFDIKGNALVKSGIDAIIEKYLILIEQSENESEKGLKFHYTIRGIISKEAVLHEGYQVTQVRYAATTIGLKKNVSEGSDAGTVRILNISGTLNTFTTCLDLDRVHYPALN